MSDRYVDIDGVGLLFYVNRKIEELKPLAEAEKERWERYARVRKEYLAIPFWKRWFTPHPIDDDGDDLLRTYLWKSDDGYRTALREAERMAVGVHADLTYHIGKCTAEWLRLGE